MRVLITGGAGYIGTELTFQLIKNNDIEEIVIFDNLSRKNYNFFIGKDKLKKVRFVQGDLLDSRKLDKILKGIDVVYHLAAQVTTTFSDEHAHSYEQINNWGTAELVYAIEKSDVKKVIYLSSVSVYGSTDATIDSTDHTKNPRTYYGITKLKGEEHIKRLATKQKQYAILRCANVFGYSKSMRFDAVINKFMFEANFANKITINGKGNQHRAFIHVGNVVNVLQQCLENNHLKNAIYNLSESNHTILEVAETIKTIYPDLEMQFINQHLPMKAIKVLPSPEIKKILKSEKLESYLTEFKGRFTF